MLITNIDFDSEKIESYNETAKELYDSGAVETLLSISSFKDRFFDYNEIVKKIREESPNIKLIPDTIENPPAVISRLSSDSLIRMFSGYKAETIDYGLCDNATQVINKYNESVKGDKTYMIVLTPIFKADQPQDYGFRFHKWGEYIGVQNIEGYEYIYDSDIDMIYVYSVYEIVKKNPRSWKNKIAVKEEASNE